MLISQLPIFQDPSLSQKTEDDTIVTRNITNDILVVGLARSGAKIGTTAI